ncbi:hypothetical protein V0288_24940 [Pannus brasiliensis CCIBt3594]|uniref:Uncharacterized protein n=1 Tax=Pannus brasiliensis CCIBt3594 TaxID=1427578 RepID=A0AAW9QTI0_9CHRO
MKSINFYSFVIWLTMLTLPAMASAQTITKTVEGGKDVIYASGLTPGSSIDLSIDSTQPRAYLTDSCGLVRVSKNLVPPTSITVKVSNSPAYSLNLADLPVVQNPACTSAGSPYDGAFTDAEGNFYHFQNPIANVPYTIYVRSNTRRRATVNQCGFARFTESATTPWENNLNFSIGTNNYNLSNIPLKNYPPICRNVGTSQSPTFVLYLPAN